MTNVHKLPQYPHSPMLRRDRYQDGVIDTLAALHPRIDDISEISEKLHHALYHGKGAYAISHTVRKKASDILAYAKELDCIIRTLHRAQHGMEPASDETAEPAAAE